MNRHAIYLGIAGSVLLAGCSSNAGGSGTTGTTVTLKTVVVVKGDLAQPKTNALGWSVTVTRAYLSVGPLYYFAGDPLLSVRDGLMRSRTWARLFDRIERPAYAHPGHYIHGDAMGQMTTPITIDLLGGQATLATGTGVTGTANSARFTWQSPPAGDKAAELGGHVVLTEGVATKGQDTIRFVANADRGDVLDGDGEPKVDGCAFGASPGVVGANVDGDGTVTLTLVPTVWFDQVDFSYVLPGSGADAAVLGEAGAVGLDAAAVEAGVSPAADGGAPDAGAAGAVDIVGTPAWQGFLRGVKKGTGYLFSYGK
jgi:hypothetical protein